MDDPGDLSDPVVLTQVLTFTTALLTLITLAVLLLCYFLRSVKCDFFQDITFLLPPDPIHILFIRRVYDRCRGVVYVTESELADGHHRGHQGHPQGHSHRHDHPRQHHYNMSPVDVT